MIALLDFEMSWSLFLFLEKKKMFVRIKMPETILHAINAGDQNTYMEKSRNSKSRRINWQPCVLNLWILTHFQWTALALPWFSYFAHQLWLSGHFLLVLCCSNILSGFNWPVILHPGFWLSLQLCSPKLTVTPFGFRFSFQDTPLLSACMQTDPLNRFLVSPQLPTNGSRVWTRFLELPRKSILRTGDEFAIGKKPRFFKKVYSKDGFRGTHLWF